MRVIFSASARCAARREREEGKVGHEALLAIPSCGVGEACRSLLTHPDRAGCLH